MNELSNYSNCEYISYKSNANSTIVYYYISCYYCWCRGRFGTVLDVAARMNGTAVQNFSWPSGRPLPQDIDHEIIPIITPPWGRFRGIAISAPPASPLHTPRLLLMVQMLSGRIKPVALLDLWRALHSSCEIVLVANHRKTGERIWRDWPCDEQSKQFFLCIEHHSSAIRYELVTVLREIAWAVEFCVSAHITADSWL